MRRQATHKIATSQDIPSHGSKPRSAAGFEFVDYARIMGKPEAIDRCQVHREIQAKSLDATFSNLHCGAQIRMVAGYAEVIERKEILVAGACNHPNCLVLQFSFEMIRSAT